MMTTNKQRYILTVVIRKEEMNEGKRSDSMRRREKEIQQPDEKEEKRERGLSVM